MYYSRPKRKMQPLFVDRINHNGKLGFATLFKSTQPGLNYHVIARPLGRGNLPV